jgi:uncharacterized protein
MRMDRREFMGRVAIAAGAVGIDGGIGVARAFAVENQDLFSRMSWFNEPASVKIAAGELTVRSKAKTDFWQKTFDGYVADSGHFFHLAASGDFTFTACVNGKYATQYDQAGLMVRTDAENWMRCGTEFIDGKRYASVVFTRTYSDGSTLPDLSQTDAIWWKLVRKNDSIETFCSLDGAKYMSVRMGYFEPHRSVEVGVMCAAPSGQGFDSTFKALKLE